MDLAFTIQQIVINIIQIIKLIHDIFFAGPDGKGSQRIGSINFCFAKKKGKPSKRWLKRRFFFQYFFNCFCYMNKYSGEMNCFPSFSFFFHNCFLFCRRRSTQRGIFPVCSQQFVFKRSESGEWKKFWAGLNVDWKCVNPSMNRRHWLGTEEKKANEGDWKIKRLD